MKFALMKIELRIPLDDIRSDAIVSIFDHSYVNSSLLWVNRQTGKSEI